VLGFGRYFGGDITACMQLLDEGLALCRGGMPIRDAAAQGLEPYFTSGETPPGFGHRFHSRDPRATRLFQMAMELELDGEHVRFIRALEFALQQAHEADGKVIPVNIDGAIAAVCSDLGLRQGMKLAVLSQRPQRLVRDPLVFENQSGEILEFFQFLEFLRARVRDLGAAEV